MDENQPSAQPIVPAQPTTPELPMPSFPVQKQKSEPVHEVPKELVNEVKSVASGPGKMEELSSFVQECKRVLRGTEKANKEEFTTIVKISAAGMAIIGVIGFLIHLVKELLL